MPTAHIYHFFREDGVQPIEYVILSEDVSPENAVEEFGEEGYELQTVELDIINGLFTTLPTDRKLVDR